MGKPLCSSAEPPPPPPRRHSDAQGRRGVSLARLQKRTRFIRFVVFGGGGLEFKGFGFEVQGLALWV